jgi:hypothetical protein
MRADPKKRALPRPLHPGKIIMPGSMIPAWYFIDISDSFHRVSVWPKTPAGAMEAILAGWRVRINTLLR